MSEPSNPPAFPSGLDQNAEYSRTFQSPMHEGMTLSDYFAAAALTGMLAANAQGHDELNDKNVDQVIAREAYASADAMLAERQKP